MFVWIVGTRMRPFYMRLGLYEVTQLKDLWMDGWMDGSGIWDVSMYF